LAARPAILHAGRSRSAGSLSAVAEAPSRGSGRRRRRFIPRPPGTARDAGLRLSLPFWSPAFPGIRR